MRFRPCSFKNLRFCPTALALVLVATQIQSSAQQLPLIGAMAEVQASNFRETLSPTDLLRVQTEMAAELRKQCSNYFDFCRWTDVSDGALPTNAAAGLKVMLLGEDSPIGVKVSLRIAAVAGSKVETIPDLPDRTLYEAENPDPPTQDAERLAREARQAIREEFASDAKREKLQQGFFSQIPVAMHLELQAHRFVIPLPRSLLLAGEGSLFRARFALDPPLGESNPYVVIEMGAEDGALNSKLDCFLLEFRHPNKLLTKGQWDTLIEESHQHAAKGIIPVCIERYQKRLPLRDGLVEDAL